MEPRVYRNKQDQDGIVVRNKARLVVQGYTQVKGLDFGETYAPVARLEAIRILLAYACAHNIKLYQMDIKSAFISGYINEEVYVEQPSSFEDDKKPNQVYKLKKALYLWLTPLFSPRRLARTCLCCKSMLMTSYLDQKLYRSMIGSLLYVTASRPDVMFSVYMFARFQASPRESHLKAIRRM